MTDERVESLSDDLAVPRRNGELVFERAEVTSPAAV